MFSTYGDIEKEPHWGICKKARSNREHVHRFSAHPAPNLQAYACKGYAYSSSTLIASVGHLLLWIPAAIVPITYLFPKPTSGLKTAVCNIWLNASLSYKNASPPSSTASFSHSHSFPVSWLRTALAPAALPALPLDERFPPLLHARTHRMQTPPFRLSPTCESPGNCRSCQSPRPHLPSGGGAAWGLPVDALSLMCSCK